MGVRRRVAAAVAVVAVAGGATAYAMTRDSGRAAATTTIPVATAVVTQGALAAQIDQSGTLAYRAEADGTPFPVVGQRQGVYTWLPAAGAKITCGHRLYRVGNTPIVLLCGAAPMYRTLAEGDSGWDVRELNGALADLGYTADAGSDYFGSETEAAVRSLQDDHGVTETGTLELGDALFLPGPLRVNAVPATLGTAAGPGSPVLQATTTAREVTVQLDPGDQARVKVGDAVRITLPDNSTTSGVVRRIGTIAGKATTIPVYIALRHPKEAGHLDHAPVQVEITVAGVKDATIVPVTSLMGLAGGGYAVERVDADGTTHLVPVTLGLFDDAEGLVQVTGQITAGQRVAVPST